MAPVVAASSAGGPGVGLVHEDRALPWVMISGPQGSAFHFYGTPDADAAWVFDHIFKRLEGVSAPWRRAIVTMDAMADPVAAHVVNHARRGVPAWEIPRLGLAQPERAKPPVPSGIVDFLLNSGWEPMDGNVYKGVLGLENGRTQVLLVGSDDAEHLGLLSPVCDADNGHVPIAVTSLGRLEYPVSVHGSVVMMEDRLSKSVADADQRHFADRLIALAIAAHRLEQQVPPSDTY